MTLCERAWDAEKHLRHLHGKKWEPMQDDGGNILEGIDGKRGVRGTKKDGTHIGCDFIRMRPGSRFPLHIHEGDHAIYIIKGNGFVHIDGRDIAVTAGHMIYIPAEYPHGVWVAEDAPRPLVFAATGHPHYHVDSRNRMKIV